jgi:hypothetical protein
VPGQEFLVVRLPVNPVGGNGTTVVFELPFSSVLVEQEHTIINIKRLSIFFILKEL